MDTYNVYISLAPLDDQRVYAGDYVGDVRASSALHALLSWLAARSHVEHGYVHASRSSDTEHGRVYAVERLREGIDAFHARVERALTSG